MELSELEQLVFSYYVANDARTLNMAPRRWPYGELVHLIEDKIQVAVRKFGIKSMKACPNVARAYLDLLIEREGFSTVANKFGGTMHRYEAGNYVSCIGELQKTNPIILQAEAAGAGFWEDAFAGLLSGVREG